MRRSKAPSIRAMHIEARRLLSEQQFDRAARYLRSCLKSYPNDLVTLTNLAALAYNEGNSLGAENYLNKARALPGGKDSLHFRYTEGLLNLRRGKWLDGWGGFEFRFPLDQAKILAPMETLWHGEFLGPTKTLYVWCEQGLGDQIMCSRFVPRVREISGAKVVLVVDQKLVRLFKGLADEVTSASDMVGSYRHIPIMSLCGILGVTPDNLDGKPYLSAPRGEFAGPLRLGLAWKGNAQTLDFASRHLKEEQLDNIKEIVNGNWRCLQYGEHDFYPEDMFETALDVVNCDLVITVDTSVAHLTGALGVPCWVLLRSAPDWRWLEKGDTSPWYDSVKLYRQEIAGSWTSPLARIEHDLKELVNNGRPDRAGPYD